GSEFREDALDLHTCGFERAGVVDNEAALRDPDGVGNLGGQALTGIALGGGAFLRGSVRRKSALEVTLDLEVVGSSHQDDAVESLTPPGNSAPGFGLEDQRGFNHNNRVGILGKDF